MNRKHFLTLTMAGFTSLFSIDAKAEQIIEAPFASNDSVVNPSNDLTNPPGYYLENEIVHSDPGRIANLVGTHGPSGSHVLRNAIMKFELPELTDSVLGAEFRYTKGDDDSGDEVPNLDLYGLDPMDSAFAEDETLAYASPQADDRSFIGFHHQDAVLAEDAPRTSYTVDVGGYIAQLYDGTTPMTDYAYFRFSPAAELELGVPPVRSAVLNDMDADIDPESDFHAHDESQLPQLTIVVPEPSTLLMLGFGGSLMMLRRRSRRM